MYLSLSLVVLLLGGSAVAKAQMHPHADNPSSEPGLIGQEQRPAGCFVLYDANLGQGEIENISSAAPCCATLGDGGLIWDLLVADDFSSENPGHITDAFIYLYVSGLTRTPQSGARIYLWGAGEMPTEEPTQVWDISPQQVRFWSLGWWEHHGYVMQVTGLNIPYDAGRNWITIQPRDLEPGADWYYAMRNERTPLQGSDSFIKDGPDAQRPGFGFTDWRSAGSTGYGFGVADSFIRLETCDGPGTLNISLDGQCGGMVTFSWENAPPNKTMNVIYARETGEFRLGHTHGCPSTLLGLGRRGIREAFRIETSTGTGSVQGRLRASACPGYFQAVIGGVGPCQVSNVISTP